MMNLQEHIGQYLFLKQLEQQERYELFIASKQTKDFEQTSEESNPNPQIKILEVLCTARDDSKLTGEQLEQNLNKLWGDDEYAHLQGWQRVKDIELKDRMSAQFQPLYTRPYNQKVSLHTLMKVMRQKNRRFPLPQALKLACFTLKAAANLIRLKPESLIKLETLVHVGYQGKLSINDHSINQIVLGHAEPSNETETIDSLLSVAQLVVALTCDIHLSDTKRVINASQLGTALNERFQGPPPLKNTLANIIDQCLSSTEIEEYSHELEKSQLRLYEEINAHSLDCPDVLIETFLNSVYPFESSQAKQELKKYRQRAIEVYSPNHQRLKMASLDDFLSDDEHTQTTLSVLPTRAPGAAMIEQYDALSTDSDSGSSEDYSVDDEALNLRIDLNHETQEAIILKEQSPDESPNSNQDIEEDHSENNETQASSSQNPNTSDTAELSKDNSGDVEDNKSSQQSERGLLPPRPSDIHSIEAQSRRERGRQLNTMDFLAPIDDFDSIDITGSQAAKLREVIEEESKADQGHQDQKPNKPSFAGSFKYPVNYEAEVSTTKYIQPTISNSPTSAKQSELSSNKLVATQSKQAQNQAAFYKPISPRKKGSPIFLAAILAVVTAIASNFLASYLTKEDFVDSFSKSTENRSTQAQGQIKKANADQSQTPEESSVLSNKPQKKESESLPLQLRQLNTEVQVIWLPKQHKSLSQLEELKALKLDPNTPIVLWAKKHLPMQITWSELIKQSTSKEKLEPISLMAGTVPTLDFKLKVGPSPKKMSIMLNGEIQDRSKPLNLPIAVMNMIQVKRSGYQDHVIYLKPQPSSLQKQSVFLKSAKRAKPEITLRSSVGSAELSLVNLGKPQSKARELGEGLSRIKYAAEQELKFIAKHKGMRDAEWYFKSEVEETPTAYTIRLDPLKEGHGELKFSGGYGLEMTIQPLFINNSVEAQNKLKDKYKLPQALELTTGEYAVSINDPKLLKSYRFTVEVYAKQSSQWKLAKEKVKEKEKKSSYSWKADFVRFKPYRLSKKKN